MIGLSMQTAGSHNHFISIGIGVGGETSELATFTLENTINAGININQEPFLSLLDRGLALKSSIFTVIPSMGFQNCQKHIDSNLTTKKWPEIIRLWHVANQALSVGEKEWAMSKIRSTSAAAADYIEEIEGAFLLKNHELGYKLYGMLTSNLIEQLYSEFLEIRRTKCIFSLLYSVIEKSLEKQEREKSEAEACKSYICTAALTKVEKIYDDSLGFN